MKTVKAWAEEVFYWECPHCGETMELGSGVMFSDPEEEECTACGIVCLVADPEADIEELRKA